MIKLIINFWRNWGLLSRLLLMITTVIIVTSMGLVLVQLEHVRVDANASALQDAHEIHEVIVPAIVEQAILGDYATIKQILQRFANERPELLKISWQNHGVSITADDPSPITMHAPHWFYSRISLPDLTTTQKIHYFDQDYGELTIVINPAIAINTIWDDLMRLTHFSLSALGLIWMFSYFILRRNLVVLNRLVTAVSALKLGNYDMRVQVVGAPELRTLVHAFNDGNERLAAMIAELRKRELDQASQLEQITAQNFAYQEQRRAMDAAAIIAETDLQGSILYVNDKFCEISGYSREELLGQNHRLLNSGTHPAEFFRLMWTTISRGEVWHGEICNRDKGGRLYWVQTTIVPILDEVTQHAKRYQAICFDITERKQAEQDVMRISHQLQDMVAAASEVAIIATDTDGTVTLFNTGAERMLGYQADEVVGQITPGIFHLPEEVAQRGEELSRELGREVTGFEVFTARASLEGQERREWIYVCKNGVHIQVSLGVTAIRGVDGTINGFLGIALDITQRKQLEAAWYQEKERAEVTLASIGDAVLATDADGRITFINTVALQLTGWSLAEALGQSVEKVFNIVNEYTRNVVESPVREALRTGNVIELASNTVLISHKGIEYNIEDSAAPIFMRDGSLLGCVLVFHDVTERHRLMKAVHWQAGHDTLTNLPNRALLNDRFGHALSLARRNDTLTVVCLLDLDEFKPINDTFGHEMGDAVLVEVANRLSNTVREEDTVARLGGDEFVLLLNEFEDIDGVEMVVNRILNIISKPYLIGKEILHINASIGMTLFPFDDADPDTLLRHADQAMYQAKQAGRNRYHLFDLVSDVQAQTSLRKIERVRQALLNDELCLYYQPKVNMRTGMVVGMEALLRWNHPERGIVPPMDFLPLIEETELIVEIGEWVIKQALTQIGVWLDKGYAWVVSVNIAGLHFQRHNFSQQLSLLLAEHPLVPPKLLQIEILESATLGDLGYAHDMVVSCQNMGVTFALDDFGTGYSSLAYLKRLPANSLKIDQSFVRDMLVNREGFALVEAIISLATVFGSEVIAEGVESAEHGVLLMRLGCDLAQGYGIARPMPKENVIEWVRHYVPDTSWRLWADIAWELSDFPLLVAQYDHLSWVKKVVGSVFDAPLSLPENELIDHHQCRFGHWYYGLGKTRYGHLQEFAGLEKIHTEVHLVGKRMVELYQGGDKDAAKVMSEQLLKLKDRVLISLGNLQRMVAARSQADPATLPG